MYCEENNIEDSDQKLVDKNSMVDVPKVCIRREKTSERESIILVFQNNVVVIVTIDSFTVK